MAYDIEKLAGYQQEVQKLHNRYCRDIPKRMGPWVVKQAKEIGFISFLADKRRLNEAWCPICGKIIPFGSEKCPHCGAKLREQTNPYRGGELKGCGSYKDFFLFEQITTCKEWQIVRVWLADFKFRRGREAELTYLGSIYERWFNPTIGKEVLLGKYRGSFPYYRRIPWALSCYGPTEGYVHRSLLKDSYDERGEFIYPNARLLDWYKDKGAERLCEFTEDRDFLPAFRLLGSTKRRTITETMLKVGRDEEIRLMLNKTDKFFKYWRTILVARRHHFDYTRHGSEYFDYLDQLAQLHLDLRSPHYVAPSDFHAMHQTMTNRLNAIAERRRREWQRQREIEEYKRAQAKDAEYKKAREMYFGLVLTSGTYKAEPLKSVEEFLNEGLAMDHCVFSCGYYDVKRHPDSLILSVRNNEGAREVTIEIDTKKWKIAQCYAKHDSIHPKNKQIRKWINSEMETIKGFSKPAKRITATA